MMVAHNPNCFIVTGRPRTPRDQGSVESANKLVQRVLKSISSERRLQSLDVNWTNLLGQVMSVCNSHSGRKKYSVSSYEAVFGQRFHPQLKCNLREMRQCRSIFQRLKLSPDERLQTYVDENDIVDIEFNDDVATNLADETDDENEQEGVDIGDDAFPELETEEICPGASVDDRIDVDCGTAQNVEQTDDNEYATINSNVPCGIGANIQSSPSDWLLKSSIESPQTTPKPSPSDWLLEPPTVCVPTTDDGNKELYSKLNLEEAWDRGDIARSDRPLSSHGRKEYMFLMPMLTCRQCCYPNGSVSISVGDNRYIESIRTTTNWYDGVFVSSFVQLASHYAHTTVNERFVGDTEAPDMPMVIHITFPRQQLQVAQCKKIPDGVTRVVGVMHDADHYAVLEIDLTSKQLIVYDGLNRDLIQWMDHIDCALKRCMRIPLDAAYVANGDEPVLIKSGRREQVKIQGYSLSYDYSQQWRLVRGEFLKQVDSYNCGPIACVKILEMFNLVSLHEVRLAYGINSLRTMVANEWKRFLKSVNNDLIVSVKKRIPRHETAAVEPMESVLSTRNTTWLRTTLAEPPISNATAASSEADETDYARLCFCCCDDPLMELTRTECCKQFVHRKCFIAHLQINSQCCYCHRAITDIVAVIQQPAIDRSEPLPPTPPKTPLKRSPGKKRDLQQLQFEETTPLRIADQVRSTSQEKKRHAQEQQAKRMVKAQGKYIAKEGGGPGAIVTVKPDYRAVSHNIGIVGVMYDMKSTGGARIVTIAGMLSSGPRKGNWWIPSDQYTVNYTPNEVANIPPQLEEIRQAILSGDYNKNNDARRCTIQEAHQIITQAISPCRKGKCSCIRGECKKGRCGCIIKGFKCTSACSCYGNCNANPNNGK